MASDRPLPDLKSKSAFLLRLFHNTNLYIAVGLTLGHIFALGLCLARSYLRVKKGRVWWDDYMAMGAAALDLVYLLSLWVKALHRTS